MKSAKTPDAKAIISQLGMQPHPEGGWFAETFRDGKFNAGRAASTAIYYLLEAGDRSHWHRVDAAEIWHYYAGAPLILSTSTGSGQTDHTLGPGIALGQRPQMVVPMGHWQSAATAGAFTLAGCTVAPGFEFSGFELAPEDWAPR